jgi:hypothetical protein
MKLIYPKGNKTSPLLVEEDDGLFFVDYVGITMKSRPKTLVKAIASIVQSLMLNESPSIREKGMWLASYSDAVLGTNHKSPRFVGKRVKK